MLKGQNGGFTHEHYQTITYLLLQVYKIQKKKKTSFGLIILCIDLDTIHTIP